MKSAGFDFSSRRFDEGAWAGADSTTQDIIYFGKDGWHREMRCPTCNWTGRTPNYRDLKKSKPIVGGSHRVQKTKKDWERIDRLPDWARRKMKKHKTHKVNGNNYVYKKEGKRYYRRKK